MTAVASKPLAQQQDQISLWLKIVTTVLVVYTPNQLHFPSTLGLPGVNVLNVICLLMWLMHLAARRPKSVKPVLRGPLFFFFFAVIYGFILAQVLSADDVMEDFVVVKTLIFYQLFYFIFFHVIRDDDDIRLFTYIILIVALIAACEAIKEWIDYGVTSYKDSARASGPFGEDYRSSNRAGAFYAIFVPMALVCAFYAEPGHQLMRWAVLSGPVLLSTAIFATYSRQAYAIGAVSLVLFSLRKGPVAIALLAILLATNQYWLPDTAVQRVEVTKQVNEDGVETVDSSTESRMLIWQGAMKMYAAFPAGVGLARFRNHIGDFSNFDRFDAHNFYVLTLAEIGPLGITSLVILVLSMVALGFRLTRRAKRRGDKFGQMMGLAFTLMSINMILTNIYGSPFASGEVMGLYWAFAGLCARRLQNLRTREPTAERPAGQAAPAAPFELAPGMPQPAFAAAHGGPVDGNDALSHAPARDMRRSRWVRSHD